MAGYTLRCFRNVCAFAFFLLAVVNTEAQDSRAVDFTAGWKFFKGDGVEFEKAAFNDSQWRQLDLPHDWSVEGPFSDQWASGTGYLPGGIGWYRKSFEATKGLTDKLVYLYFDGVYKNSEVWINEHYLGKRPNGYASFFYEISKYVKKSGRNVIAVKVDHTDFADARWYPGSGINRKVYLIKVNPVHIDVWGIAFTTPNVSKENADVEVNIDIRNESLRKGNARVTTELISSKGEVVAKQNADILLDKNASRATLRFSVSNPSLWSVEHPTLYHLKTSVTLDKKVVDVVTEQVGFRSFTFDKDKGFFLNGEQIKLKGVCVHDDAGALGSAVPAAVWERRLRILKAAGVNAIRMSHNPHQDYFYDLCDRLGFLVQDEAFDEWEIGKNKWIKGWNVGTPGKDGYSKDFKQWAERDLGDMILRNRNRTSIIMWSIGNEIDYPNDPYTHEILNTGRNPQIYGKGYQPGNPPAAEMGVIAKRLVDVVRKLDATRPVTAALAGVVMSNETTYPDVLDVVGYNYQEYRYDDDHQKFPNRIIYGSENGQSFDAWKAVSDHDFISAQFLWTGFDFLGEARAWPVRSSGAGMLDLAGFPKPQYYFRKSLWTNEPFLSVLTTIGNREKGFSDPCACWNYNASDSVSVIGVGNVDEIEVIVNGRSYGKKTISDRSSRTPVKVLYEPGEVMVKGFKAQREVTNQKLQTSGSTFKLRLEGDRQVLAANRDSVAHIEVYVADEKGIIVAQANQEVEVIIKGPGKLIGLESGDLSSHENYKANKRKLYKGKLLAYVQATSKGEIVVEVKSPGLASASIAIKTLQ